MGKALKPRVDWRKIANEKERTVLELDVQLATLKRDLADELAISRHRLGEIERVGELLRDSRRQVAMLAEQRGYLMGVCKNLLDRLVGTQLTTGISNFEMATRHVTAEHQAFDEQLAAIAAKHQPAPEETAEQQAAA